MRLGRRTVSRTVWGRSVKCPNRPPKPSECVPRLLAQACAMVLPAVLRVCAFAVWDGVSKSGIAASVVASFRKVTSRKGEGQCPKAIFVRMPRLCGRRTRRRAPRWQRLRASSSCGLWAVSAWRAPISGVPYAVVGDRRLRGAVDRGGRGRGGAQPPCVRRLRS